MCFEGHFPIFLNIKSTAAASKSGVKTYSNSEHCAINVTYRLLHGLGFCTSRHPTCQVAKLDHVPPTCWSEYKAQLAPSLYRKCPNRSTCSKKDDPLLSLWLVHSTALWRFSPLHQVSKDHRYTRPENTVRALLPPRVLSYLLATPMECNAL